MNTISATLSKNPDVPFAASSAREARYWGFFLYEGFQDPEYRHANATCFDHLDCVPDRRRDGGLVLRMHARDTLAARLQDVRRLKKSFDYRSDPPSAELARAWRRAFRSLRDEPGRITG